MLELIVAVYGFICWLVFKKFKLIPVNDYTVVTAIFIPVMSGIFGFLILNMYGAGGQRRAALRSVDAGHLPDSRQGDRGAGDAEQTAEKR